MAADIQSRGYGRRVPGGAGETSPNKKSRAKAKARPAAPHYNPRVTPQRYRGKGGGARAGSDQRKADRSNRERMSAIHKATKIAMDPKRGRYERGLSNEAQLGQRLKRLWDWIDKTSTPAPYGRAEDFSAKKHFWTEHLHSPDGTTESWETHDNARGGKVVKTRKRRNPGVVRHRQTNDQIYTPHPSQTRKRYAA